MRWAGQRDGLDMLGTLDMMGCDLICGRLQDCHWGW